MQTIIYRVDKQQSPTVELRELWSIFYNKLTGKGKKRGGFFKNSVIKLISYRP